MIRKAITLTDNWQDESLSINAVIYHGDSDQLKETCQQIAQRKGGYYFSTKASHVVRQHCY